MTFQSLITQNLKHYWHTNLAVVLGVATAVAVLAGALLVGSSVRGSLRELALQRLGKTDLVVTGTSFFRAALANEIGQHSAFAANFSATVPLIVMPATVTHSDSNARASNVQIYGVDDRFWQFHQLPSPAGSEDDAFISAALARELNAKTDDTLVIRIEKPSAIPLESLHGRKDEAGTTLRLSTRAVLPATQMGEFSLRPTQGSVLAVFVSLAKLQKNLDQADKANALLLAAKNNHAETVKQAEQILRERFELADLGLKLRVIPNAPVVALESDSALLTDAQASGAQQASAAIQAPTAQVLTYLANGLKANGREVPYSLVTALDDTGLHAVLGKEAALPGENQLILNDWAARDLGAKVGDALTLEYYLWQESGQLITQTAAFNISHIVPISGAAADRNYAPDYPGITDTDSLADWDPPFPIDLDRVRPIDEDYWKAYRTTPKVFMRLADGQKLWASRYGNITSLRAYPTTDAAAALNQWSTQLRQQLDPLQSGLSITSVKSDNQVAAKGATDFGEYFSYFSFFLVISALLLTGLFFKLGIEQRLREIGLLQALGFTPAKIRSLFLREGFILALIGSLLGVLGAIAYGALMMYGLRTWWVGAVGTTLLRLHVDPTALATGFGAGIVTALFVVWWSLRSLRQITPRQLLAGASNETLPTKRKTARWSKIFAIVFGLLGFSLLAASAAKLMGQTGGFFGAGFCLLIAALFGWSVWLRKAASQTMPAQGWAGIAQFGFRNATVRAGRSVLCIALIAYAAFIIVAVDAFRKSDAGDLFSKNSGTGGFYLFAESQLPLIHDPNSALGRDELNLNDPLINDVTLLRFRLRPGDDASCLNLYAPRNPRMLGASNEFIQQGRFSFASSLAQTPEEKANPWLLLNLKSEISNLKSEIPVIADANSMQYVLHKSLGDTLEINDDNGNPVKLKLVAALSDSMLQGELLMSEDNFKRLFPGIAGYRFFLIDTTRFKEADALLEDRLSDYGFDVQNAPAKLASFHQVENTYLSTFQALGGLGLLLGTVGLAAVLLRNVFERRRELALLRATGYQPQHLSWLILAENVLLLGCGLLTGIICALIAIAPAFVARGGHVSFISLFLLLLAVLLTGLASSWLAVRAAVKAPLLEALRAE